jgi:hypothetical protein
MQNEFGIGDPALDRPGVGVLHALATYCLVTKVNDEALRR